MKIGIITFHRAINYGAVLQTYALQKFLENKKYDAEVIDYRCDYMENFYKIIGFKNKTLKQSIRSFLNIFPASKKKKSFKKFLINRIQLSKIVYNKDNIVKSNQKYDKFITGSDQVFNFACSGFDKNYFLDFVEESKKKYSYAASFGMKKIPLNLEKDYKQLLKKFNRLSIRETTGQEIVKNLIATDTELSLDPVFLLNLENWNEVVKKPRERNYILVYKLNSSELIYDFARELSKKTGKKILALNFDVVDQIKTKDIKGILSASIEEFLGFFKYADYIVTNSFHGTAFSIIFHKEFYVEALQKNFKPNDRVESLLNMTGLDGCKITGLVDCILSVERNYNYVDTILEKERQKASRYLEMILND